MEKSSPEQQTAEKPYQLPSRDALIALAEVRKEFGEDSELYQDALGGLRFATIKANDPKEVEDLMSDMRNLSPSRSEAKLLKGDQAKVKLALLHEKAESQILAALDALADE